MSFDSRSRERLQALGRTLPQPLPSPTPPQQVKPNASETRHRVELEQNPEALFHELMQVSRDGTVPPHLMERLRDLEARRRQSGPVSGSQVMPSSQANRSKAQQQAKPQASSRTVRNSLGRADARTAAEHPDLYTAFQQLLLEDDIDP